VLSWLTSLILGQVSSNNLMSKLSVVIDEVATKDEFDMEPEQYRKYLIEFAVRIKFAMVAKLSAVYDVTHPTALSLIRIHDRSTSYEVGLDSPEMYPTNQRATVTTVMKYDLGSVSENIRPLFIMKDMCDYLSANIGLLWIEYVNNRERSVNEHEQYIPSND
jgi:hypothetical protein